MVERALEYHQSGLLTDARGIYEAILEQTPGDFDARHLLGVIAIQEKNARLGVELISAAIANDPGNPASYAALGNLGAALRQLGRFQDALNVFNRAIALKVDYADGYLNRGHVFMEMRRPNDAAESYRRAIDVRNDFAEAHFFRGNALVEQRKFESALVSYSDAIDLRPSYAEAHCRRGNLLLELKRLTEALASYDRAIEIAPTLAEAHCSRGNVLKELRQPQGALESYNKAIELRPDFAAAHCNRGNVLFEMVEFFAALESFDKAIELKPDYAEAHCNRGNALLELRSFGRALESLDHAIKLRPHFAEAYSGRGNVLVERRELSAAVDSYQTAVRLKPNYAQAYLNLAMTLLLGGNYEQGWPLYEWRWKRGIGVAERARRNASKPVWTGKQSLAGRTILLHSEGGYGDTIQFCRYVPLVAALGATVILEVPDALMRLLVDLPGVAQVILSGAPAPEHDFFCPLMSLPLAFGTKLYTVPVQIPYLSAHPKKIEYWRKQLGQPVRPRVGLVWSGGFMPDQRYGWGANYRRNIPLAKLAALRHIEVEFYSLQKGAHAESELAELRAGGWDGPDLIDFTDRLNDFSDTAAFIENLDLVISVDTSTAHLAAALGKRVWILNRYDTCWRWLLDRSDSPWYPTVTLFRQNREEDWDDVVRRVRAALFCLFRLQ